MLLNPTASSSRLLQECPSSVLYVYHTRELCLNSWSGSRCRFAMHGGWPWPIQCHNVRWGPDLHRPAPEEGAISVPLSKGQFRWGRSGPLWSAGITHDNAVAHGDKMTWLVPYKLGTILQPDHLQRWAWPDDVIRLMPLVLGRQAEPDSDWLAQCPCPQSTASF